MEVKSFAPVCVLKIFIPAILSRPWQDQHRLRRVPSFGDLRRVQNRFETFKFLSANSKVQQRFESFKRTKNSFRRAGPILGVDIADSNRQQLQTFRELFNMQRHQLQHHSDGSGDKEDELGDLSGL